MRSYEREPDVGFDESPVEAPVEWEFVRTRRRPGAPDGSLPVRLLLLDEALKVVDERGPAAVSVASCARRVGVSQGAPYTWFADAADFRCAVAANLLSILVSELSSRATTREDAQSVEPQSTALANDVGTVVLDWVGNGMGLDLVLASGGPASRVELSFAAERFVNHFRDRIHDATGCTCAAAAGIGTCHAHPELVDAVLAVCHGHAALARAGGRDAATTASAAGQAATRLTRGAAAVVGASASRT